MTPQPIVDTRDGQQQIFEIELVSMSLSSAQPIPLPSGGQFDLALQMQELPDQQNALPAGVDGHVTVLKLADGGGGGGGRIAVDSFFDVFVDLSINGGPPIPAEGEGTSGPLRLAASNTVPEPSTWVLLGLGALAMGAIRRKS